MDTDNRPTMYVELLWDSYVPNVESQLIKDLISLQNAARSHAVDISVVSDRMEVSRVLSSIGITHLYELPDGVEAPNLYLIYQTTEDRITKPDLKVRAIVRKLYTGESTGNKLETSDWHGMPLREQDRGFYNNQFRRAPPTNNRWSTLDPMVTMVWSR